MPEWYGGSYLNSEFLAPREHHWREHWERVKRWFARLQMIREKSLRSELAPEDIDTIIAYFQNSYHMRDWIVDSLPALSDKLTTFVDSNFEIGASRDICNGLKHKRLNNPTHDADFNFYREYDHFLAEASPNRSPIFYRFVFADGDGIRKFDAFELAQKCQQLWIEFIESNIGPIKNGAP